MRIKDYLITFPIAVINLPVYALSGFVKKKKNLWLFGARQGIAFAENSRYLFEYVTENEGDIEAYWITKDKKIVKELKRYGMQVVYAYSLRGYWLSMRCGVVFISNFRRARSDYNDFAVSRDTRIVQLWHGSPMKRIGEVNPLVLKSVVDNIVRKIVKNIFPFYKNRTSCNKMLAASILVADSLSKAFRLSSDNIWISGYPKNDLWLERIYQYGNVQKKSKAKRVIYMPTWRSDEDTDIHSNYDFNADRLNKYCVEHNIYFYFKYHHYTLENYPEIGTAIQGQSNLYLVEEDDIYAVLDTYDILITDYSSVVFDFMLSDRPIVFAPFDYEKYVSRESGFLYPYSKICSAGPVVRNWRELERSICSDFSKYEKNRAEIKKIFNSYTGCESSKRLVSLVRNMLDDENDFHRAYHY